MTVTYMTDMAAAKTGEHEGVVIRRGGEMEHFRRAETELLREVFLKYASTEHNGERHMTYNDFIMKYINAFDPESINEYTLQLFGRAADTTRSKSISFEEFQAFEALLCLPDATYALAFHLFDKNGTGYITSDEFIDIIQHTELHSRIPFNFKSDFIKLHFGKDLSRQINYTEFTQLIHDFHDEHALQAFCRFDPEQTGFINASDFNDIMRSLKSHLLSPFVKENITSTVVGGEHTMKISYPYFVAFISLLENMETVRKIYGVAARNKGGKNSEVSKDEILYEAQDFSQITPLEIEILFQLVGLRHQSGRIISDDVEAIAPLEGKMTPYSIKLQIAEENLRKQQNVPARGIVLEVAESMYRFSLGALAGAIGATAVYPIDLVKTRMQNQRFGTNVGELLYKNSFDCFSKVIRHEGVFGLYRGLAPQLVGVAPEKAIKLTMNDLMRDKLSNKDGSITLLGECISGGCAGASQVIFTNPLEIVKIRLQIAGELVGLQRISAIAVIRELGLFGLYKGAKACFLRDIPFSAIYFPAYANLKKWFADENGYNAPHTLLFAATLAGMPAAAIPTPADVIKTRLQVQARSGQTAYSGVFDCVRKIWAEEGGRAFWKGTPARVLRSSPQFGVTLMTYELLQRMLYVDFGGRRPEGSSVKKTKLDEVISKNPDHIGGYRLARATFEGIETKFGLVLPKYTSAKT